MSTALLMLLFSLASAFAPEPCCQQLWWTSSDGTEVLSIVSWSNFNRDLRVVEVYAADHHFLPPDAFNSGGPSLAT